MAEDIKEYFSTVAGKKVFVVDSRDGVSNHALEVLKITSLENQREPKFLPPDMSFFVTSLKNKNDQKEYETLCRNFNIPFGGLLKL